MIGLLYFALVILISLFKSYLAFRRDPIYAESYDPTRAITMTSERIDLRIKMRHLSLGSADRKH
jgi:hypothetical protein